MNGRRGFTLIEVLIAILVIALGIGALLTTLTSSADAVGRLREKSFAQWVALNRISELRLSRERPEVGVTSGSAQFAGMYWDWQQQISDPDMAGMLRVDVRVAPQRGGQDAARPMEPDEFAAAGIAYGFLGASVGPPNGYMPDWSFRSAARDGGSQDGGRGGDSRDGPPRQPEQPE